MDFSDPIIELAHLREANDQWKKMYEEAMSELHKLRTDLILLSRRNTMLVIELEQMKQEASK